MKQVHIWACEQAQMNNTGFKLRFVLTIVIVRQFPLNKGLVYFIKI